MSDRFEDLRVFAQVVEQASISGAAEKLEVAPSAVSRRLKDLEQRLGTQLIQRTTRKMSLTETGKQFHDRARRILADLDEAEQLASADNCALRGSLRLTIPLDYGNAVLMPILSRFAEDHPELVLDIALTDRRVDLIDEGFDASVRIGHLDDSSLIVRRLDSVTAWACASPDFIMRNNSLKTLEALESVHAIVYTNAATAVGEWRVTTPDGVARVVKPPIRMRASDGTAMKIAASNGLGVVCAPDFILADAVADGRLMRVLSDHDWGTLGVHLLYSPNRHVPARLRRLIDALADGLSENKAIA